MEKEACNPCCFSEINDSVDVTNGVTASKQGPTEKILDEEDLSQESWSTSKHLVEAMRLIVGRCPTDVCMRWLNLKGHEKSVCTYEIFWSRSGSVANFLLKSMKLKQGDRAVLCYSPGVEFYFAIWACLRTNIIAVPVYPPNPAKLEKGLSKFKLVSDFSGAKAILMDDDTHKLWMSTRLFGSGSGWPSGVEYCNTQTCTASGIYHNTTSFIMDMAGDDMVDNMAFLQFTSGSTGDPKGVIGTHKQLWHNINCIIVPSHFSKLKRCGFNFKTEKMVVVSWLPQYHDSLVIGQCFVSFSPLSFMSNPLLWINAMSKYRATVSAAPNFAYGLVTKRVRSLANSMETLPHIDLSSICFLANGAERVQKETIDSFQTAFRPFGFQVVVIPGYGLVEHV